MRVSVIPDLIARLSEYVKLAEKLGFKINIELDKHLIQIKAESFAMP